MDFAQLVCLAASLLFASATFADAVETVELKGKQIVVDDALFTGCYHNAFEGEVLNPSKGVYKTGRQAVQRTKGVLTGAGTSNSTMTLAFDLASVPAGDARLTIRGIDDRFEESNPLRVVLNDRELADALTFPTNQNIANKLNQRYFLGWEDHTIVLPAGVLKAGRNILTIANTADVFVRDHWCFAVIDHVTFDFASDADVTIERQEYPVFYYGLNVGPEPHLWPAVNYGNRVCLLADAALEYNFFVTLPKDKPLGTGEPVVAESSHLKRDVKLHFVTDMPLKVTNLAGETIEGKAGSGGTHYTFQLSRLVNYETPHPAQGERMFLTGVSPIEGKTLTVWWSVDGIDYAPKKYPLRCVALEPLKDRESINFLMSLWGGNAPKDDEGLARYISLLKSAGFNHQFTGDSPELNERLQQEGFKVYPRYGWFGHQFNVTEENQQHAAYNHNGDMLKKDFCPLAILDNPDDADLGRFFKRAENLAKLPHIDGICVDYETAAVWCWCDRCLALFEKETSIDIAGRADVAPDGAHADAYRDFGRSLNRRLLTKVKEVMLAQNPKLQYHCLASAADLPTYWYDGRERGRHTVSELVKFADAIYGSQYCYETPGGLGSVIPVVNTIKRLAVESGRSVGVNLITPVSTTVSELPRYRGVHLKPDMTRMMILLLAASGGEGLSLFRGDCMDGEQYVACRRAISELIAMRDYLHGLNRSFEVNITPVAQQRPIFHTDIAQNLMSRFVWRPDRSYEYDAIHLVKNKMGRDRVILVFNYATQPQTFKLQVRGLYDPTYELTNFNTGESLGTFGRIQLESGQPTVTVPTRDCLIIRMTTANEEN